MTVLLQHKEVSHKTVQYLGLDSLGLSLRTKGLEILCSYFLYLCSSDRDKMMWQCCLGQMLTQVHQAL